MTREGFIMTKWQAFALIIALWGITIPHRGAQIFFMAFACVVAYPLFPWNEKKEDE